MQACSLTSHESINRIAPAMAMTVPQFNRNEVNKAGRVLHDTNASDSEIDEALVIINNWRSSHNFPLNTFQTTLRHKARLIDPECLVAQRIKRLASMQQKLRRFQSMKLSQMQDIGGCRAVMSSIDLVKLLVRGYKESHIKHRLDHVKDYIQNPKASGYRGMHMIYAYFSDKKDTYNGLKIEIQIRTKLQHAWSTAVETNGTFLRQSLKSSQGEADWLRFFELMGSAIALRENCPPVEGTPRTKKALRLEIKEYARRLEVKKRMISYNHALKTIAPEVFSKDYHYYLLQLDIEQNSINIRGYKQAELQQASDDYLEVEKRVLESQSSDAVLVSAESVDALKQAYPNYFLDTANFLKALDDATS